MQHTTFRTHYLWLIALFIGLGMMGYNYLNVQRAAAAAVPDQAATIDQALPDLVFESVTIDPPNPQIGDTVNVQMVIRNQGDSLAGGFRVHLYWNPTDRPPTASTADTSTTFFGLGLGPGQTIEWRREVDVTSSDLTHYAWVDRDNEVAESDEGNNLYEYRDSDNEDLPTVEPTPTLPNPPAGTPPPPGIGPDIYEEDDVCQQAKFIPTDGTAQQRNLYPTIDDVEGDFDWVRFNVVSGVEYHIVASPNGEAGRDANITLEVHGTCEEPPGFPGDTNVLRFTAETTGTYFLWIKSTQSDYGPNTDYTLTITSENSCTDSHEPNDSHPRASGILANGTAQEYRFCQIEDVDWLWFEGQAGLEYQVSFENVDDGADAQIEIHGNCGPSLSHIGPSESLRFHAPTDGPICLRLANRDSQRYGPDTTYTVQVEQVGEATCGPDPYDQGDNDDDTMENARSVTLDNGDYTQRYNTCPANDADWVTFQAEAGKTYLIENLELEKDADPLICLYGPDQRILIECDTDSGRGPGAKIVWQAGESGRYYLELRDEDQTVAGPETAYDLRITK